MINHTYLFLISLLIISSTIAQVRLPYNNPGLSVDLGVGLWAWPIPIDYDNDGDFDLVISCPDIPNNGTFLFENPGGKNQTFPIFKPARKIARGMQNLQISYIGETPYVTIPGKHFHQFCTHQYNRSFQLPAKARFYQGKTRANQWKLADYDGDGNTDLIIGIGDWADYGWDNAYDPNGNWKNGPLHGYVYWVKNTGSNEKPKYAKPEKIKAGDGVVDTYGMPSPNLADFDGDGDLDLLCGEFLDGFTYHKNTGTRTIPQYANPIRLPISMDLQMVTPTIIDWDKDGDIDIICGDEDGRVAFIENTGHLTPEGEIPVFSPPRYFQQEAQDVKFGSLVTPVACDWDGDNDLDILCGNSAGQIAFIENLSNPGVEFPKWAPPALLEAGGKTIRIQAGENGSIQGPAEAKWGYTTISVADWDKDGLPDIIANSINGKVIWYPNKGSRRNPILEEAEPILVNWESSPPKPAWTWWNPKPLHLATQWRTTPFATDWDADGTNDIIMLDTEGYLALYKGIPRSTPPTLNPPKRIFLGEGAYDSMHGLQKRSPSPSPLQLNLGQAGKSGRRKFTFADWDLDGDQDLLVNSTNINLLKNTGTENGMTTFRDVGTLGKLKLAGHSTSPTIVDFNDDKIPDLLVGAEDGFLYYLRNPSAH